MRICEFDTCAVQVASNGTERPESTSMSGSGVVVMPTRGPDGDIVSWIDEPLLNFEWVDLVVFELAAGVKGGRSPAKRTLDAPEFDTNRCKSLIHIGQALEIATTAAASGCRGWAS